MKDNKNSNFNCDELKAYFGDLKHIKPIPLEKEKELVERIQHGDENAVNELVKANLRFVVKIAKEYRNSGIPFPDLISEGNLGLIQAAHKFDPSFGVKFIAYAVYWIRNSILLFIKKWRSRENESLDELCEEHHMTPIDWKADEPTNEVLDTQTNQNTFKDILNCLEKRELKVVSLLYGLEREKDMTLDEVGMEMNISIERVRQIKEKALTKLKCNMLSSDSMYLQFASLE